MIYFIASTADFLRLVNYQIVPISLSLNVYFVFEKAEASGNGSRFH